MSFFKLAPQSPLPWSGTDYTTSPELKKNLASNFPNLSFYWNMFFTVRRAGTMANKGKYPAEEWVQSSYEIIRAMEHCGTTFQITGMQNFIEQEGPCVFVGNHMSTLETFVLPCLIQPHKDVTFVVKDSLLKYPLFGPVLATREPIIVNRVDLRKDLTAMLQGGQERLESGRSIIVFPQGSRQDRLDPQHFNSIGVKMAKRAGVPVIPVALRTDAWGTGKIIKDFGPIRPKLNVYFKFGKAMHVTGNGKTEHAAIVDFIQTNLNSWGIAPLDSSTKDEKNEKF